MYRNLMTMVAALAMLSLATLAHAGNGAQGISKYANKNSSHTAITEFSSSSAKTSGPHR